jgi:hypothetical protein
VLQPPLREIGPSHPEARAIDTAMSSSGSRSSSWWHAALVPSPPTGKHATPAGGLVWHGRRIDMSSGEGPSYGRTGHLGAKLAEHLIPQRTEATGQG